MSTKISNRTVKVKASGQVLVAALVLMFFAWWTDQYLAQAKACADATNGQGRLQTKRLDVRAECVVTK